MFNKYNFLPNINQQIVYANWLIAIFNLLPIYPLDGGRIIKGILHIIFGKWTAIKYISDISIIICTIITAVASITILYIHNISIFFIVIYLWIIAIKERIINNKKLNIYKVVKTIENNLN